MEVVKTSFVEKRVYGVCHLMSHAEYGSERIGTGAQMGDFPKEFHRMAFLLQRVGHGIGRTVHFEGLGLYLSVLAFSLRFDQSACYADAGSGRNRLQGLFVEFVEIDDNLYILYCRSVVESDKTYLFVASACAYPPFNFHGRANRFGAE